MCVKRDVNYESKEETADLIMFTTSDTIELADAIHENSYVMIGWKVTASSINLGCTISLNYPFNEMFDNTLIELM